MLLLQQRGQKMHFQGQSLISRETIFTGRTVLTICVFRLIAWLIEYKPQEVDFLTIKGLEPTQADKAIMIFLIFLCVSHVVHWYGDYTGRWTWNSSKKYSNRALIDEGPSEMVPIFEAEEEAINLLKTLINDTNKEVLKYDSIEKLNNKLERIKKIEKITNKISKDASKHNFTAKMEFYIWHLVVPLGASAFVIFKISISLHCV